MTIFYTNPSAGGGGGDYDFIENAKVGTYSAFPKSVIEGHPKWHTGFTGQLITLGTYPELDALPDFQIEESTQNVFKHSTSINSVSQKGWTYTNNNKMYKIKNTNPITIYESNYDVDLQTETETLYLTLTNMVNPQEFFAMNDDETEMITVGRSPSNRCYHYNIITGVRTQLSGISTDPDNVLALRWEQDNNRFVMVARSTSSTVTAYTITGTTVTTEQSHSLTEGVFYAGNSSKNGTTNFVNNEYFFIVKGLNKVYSIDNTSFDITDRHTFPNNTIGYVRGMTGFKNTLVALTDYDFTNKIIQATISLDGGVTWNEYNYTQLSAPTSSAPVTAFLVAEDYMLIPHDNGTNSSKWYRVNIENNNGGFIYSTVVGDDSTSFDRGCTREDGRVFYGISADGGIVQAWQRDFKGGEGLTMPDLFFNEFPDQFIYALKHTT